VTRPCPGCGKEARILLYVAVGYDIKWLCPACVAEAAGPSPVNR
jgi:hypothetical protein